MPDRMRARATLTALLILLTVAGIRTAGPAVGWAGPARHVVVITGCVLEAVLAGLLIALRWRGTGMQSERVRAAEPGADVAARMRRILNGVLVAGLIAIPGAILISSVGTLHRTRPTPPLRRPAGRLRARPQANRTAHGAIDVALVREILFTLLLAAVITTAILLARRRRSRFRRAAVPAAEATDTPGDLARAVDQGRLALRELDDARAAIIRCYLAMEQSLAEAGAARGVAETPDELLARAVADGLVHGAPAGRLTALFYEARFSSHPMPMSQRDQAEQALAELAAALPARVTAAATAAPASDPGGTRG